MAFCSVGTLSLPVGRGRHARDLCEGSQEAGIVVEPALEGHITQRYAGADHLLGQQHPAVQHIVIDAAAGIFDKFVGEEGYAHAELPGQRFQLDGRGEMIIHIGKDLLHRLVDHDGLDGLLGAVEHLADDVKELQHLLFEEKKFLLLLKLLGHKYLLSY